MSTHYSTQIGTDIAYAATLLQGGETVAIPTETVYGLAANALDEDAVTRIFVAKERPFYNPLIVHVPNVEAVRAIVAHIPQAALLLLERFSPGPLTVLLPKKPIVSDLVTAGLPDVAVRIPAHPVALALLRECGLPLAAPSANPFGYVSPTSAEHVLKMLAGRIPYVLDGGACDAGIESTIIGFPGGVPTVYRQGVITIAMVEAVVGPVARGSSAKPVAPGMLASHYSPHTPLIITEDVDESLQENLGKVVGLMTYNAFSELLAESRQILLCTNDDFATAARNLYAALHDMDTRGYELLIAKKLPQSGIGAAINDRLMRAALK